MLEGSDVGNSNGGNLDEAGMAVSLDAAMACRWGVARRIGVAGGVVTGNCRRGAEKTRCEEMWGRENARRREALDGFN
jgi:hypothetical protein